MQNLLGSGVAIGLYSVPANDPNVSQALFTLLSHPDDVTSALHTAKILRLSEDLPLVIEIVDTQQKIDAFLPVLETMMTASGLVTLEKVQVIRYGTA